jgi:lipopolysaccharide transport system ATP-binding protein
MLGSRKYERGLQMSSNDFAIRVQGLSKGYQIYDTPKDRLKQMFAPRLQRIIGKQPKQYFREFKALNDVSFEIKKGETVGIIGRNGSGKSTLLQIICGTLFPTSGSVQTNGQIAALLELGSGFNPEFTGRENVYMNAAVLGLSKEEVDTRFDDIVTFADIGGFIEQPVKTYSSGMMVRLAFSVIAHVDAGILVIDEALAVGDVFFQQKCMRYLRKFKKKGGTTLFVSHDTSAVINLCETAILLSQNRNSRPTIGNPEEISSIYTEQLYSERTSSEKIKQHDANLMQVEKSSMQKNKHIKGNKQPENIINISSFFPTAESFGNNGAEIIDAWFENMEGSKASIVNGGDEVHFCIKVQALSYIQWPAFGFMIKDRLGQYVFAEGTDLAFREHEITMDSKEICIIKFSFLMPILIQGEYSLNVAVAEGIGDEHIQHHWINDAMTLHSIKSRLIHGICGLQNMNIEIISENKAL